MRIRNDDRAKSDTTQTKIDQLRQSSSLSLSHAAQLEQSIVSSWQRSSVAHIPKDRLAAPLLDLKKVRSPSTLSHAFAILR